MKLLIIIFLFPFVAASITETERKEVCEEIEADQRKTNVDMIKARIDQNKAHAQADLNESNAVLADLSELSIVVSNIYTNYKKYKCSKQTPACLESLDDRSKAWTDVSQAYVGLIEAYAVLSKAADDVSQAQADFKKHCVNKK